MQSVLWENSQVGVGMSDYFFFYGTLIPQFAPEQLREVLAGFQLVGEGWVRGTLYDFGNYPGAVFNESAQSRVFGRVYRAACDDLQLAELDRYEGLTNSRRKPASTFAAAVRLRLPTAVWWNVGRTTTTGARKDLRPSPAGVGVRREIFRPRGTN